MVDPTGEDIKMMEDVSNLEDSIYASREAHMELAMSLCAAIEIRQKEVDDMNLIEIDVMISQREKYNRPLGSYPNRGLLFIDKVVKVGGFGLWGSPGSEQMWLINGDGFRRDGWKEVLMEEPLHLKSGKILA